MLDFGKVTREEVTLRLAEIRDTLRYAKEPGKAGDILMALAQHLDGSVYPVVLELAQVIKELAENPGDKELIPRAAKLIEEIHTQSKK